MRLCFIRRLSPQRTRPPRRQCPSAKNIAQSLQRSRNFLGGKSGLVVDDAVVFLSPASNCTITRAANDNKSLESVRAIRGPGDARASSLRFISNVHEGTREAFHVAAKLWRGIALELPVSLVRRLRWPAAPGARRDRRNERGTHGWCVPWLAEAFKLASVVIRHRRGTARIRPI
jgi:hypothetical protein